MTLSSCKWHRVGPTTASNTVTMYDSSLEVRRFKFGMLQTIAEEGAGVEKKFRLRAYAIILLARSTSGLAASCFPIQMLQGSTLLYSTNPKLSIYVMSIHLGLAGHTGAPHREKTASSFLMHRSSIESQHVRSEAPLLTLPEACLARVKWRDGMQPGQSVLSMRVMSVRGCREWLMEEVCRLLPSEFCCGVAGLSKPAASLHPVSWVHWPCPCNMVPEWN
jgi:hypothetical protein